MSFLEDLGAVGWIILSVVGSYLIWAIGAIIYRRNRKKKNNVWLEENQNASKIFMKQNDGTLFIQAIDGENPRMFSEGLKSGFYLNPGEHFIESSYAITKPGIPGVTRSRSTTYGPSKQRVLIEVNKTYEYSFNSKEKNFVFCEFSK